MLSEITRAQTIILNKLSNELAAPELLTEHRIERMAFEYMSAGIITLPESLHRDLEKQSEGNAGYVLASLEALLYLSLKRYQPDESEKFAAEAEVILVKIDGRLFETYIDSEGTQRFKGNSVIRHLYASGTIDVNALTIEYHNGKFANDDWLDFYAGLGYSVSGLMDLSFFAMLDIDNPISHEAKV